MDILRYRFAVVGTIMLLSLRLSCSVTLAFELTV